MLTKNGINYKTINATTLEVSSKFHIEPTIEDFEITKLQIKNETIKLKDTFAFEKEERKLTYEINHIVDTGNNSFLLQSELKNKTSIYILPILRKLCIKDIRRKEELNASTLREISKYCYNTYFINTLIEGDSIDTVTGNIYLKYMFSTHPTYQNMEHLVSTIHPYFNEVCDMNNRLTYIKFKVPNKYIGDLKCFLEGKYSKLSKELKRDIITFHEVSKKSNLYQILYEKDNPDCKYRQFLEKELGADLQGVELDDIPDAERNLIVL